MRADINVIYIHTDATCSHCGEEHSLCAEYVEEDHDCKVLVCKECLKGALNSMDNPNLYLPDRQVLEISTENIKQGIKNEDESQVLAGIDQLKQYLLNRYHKEEV